MDTFLGVMIVVCAFLLGMFFTGFLYAYSIDHGKLPRGLLKQKEELLALLMNKSLIEGGDAHPQASESGSDFEVKSQ